MSESDSPEALVTLDLTGPETPRTFLGRIVGGILLMILGVALTAGTVALFVASFFVASLADWWDLIADGAYIAIGLGLGLTIAGFEVLRRGRKRRAAGMEAVANFLGTTGLAETETIDTTPRPESNPPPPKTLI